MTPQEWRQLLKDWFLVPGYPSVYVLGSFARHVTLYSQQVRAINLVTALVETGEITEGREVVVVGGGAAGLTAAAAAARRKANVVVLEKLEGLMELQGNNRQRWLHPYIYDWPYVDCTKRHESDLPFLNWVAGDAESVARTITEQWEDLVGPWKIDVRLNAEYVQIADGDHSIISWQDETENKPHRKHGALIILAIGFGLEPTTNYGDSYWVEDNLDTRFRTGSGERWLISGFGDGAFTDLIRLCFKRFRQGEIAALLENVVGIGDIKDQLKDMHASGSATAEELTKAFQKLGLSDLIRSLKPRVRRHGPKLFLVGKDSNPYGPGASILNRLVVYALENMNAFVLLKGPVDVNGIQPGKNGYDVPLYKGAIESFHRIILRHGPRPGALEKDFRPIFDACAELRERWENLPMRQDKTRTKLWRDDLYRARDGGATRSDWIQEVSFEPFALTTQGIQISYHKEVAITGQDMTVEKPETTLAISGPLEVHFAPGTSKFGVRASVVEVVKKVRNDGVSTLDYAVKGLQVLAGELKGLRFQYQAAVGQVGHPILNADARAGLRWEDDPQPDIENKDFDSTMAAMRERVRKLAGAMWFQKARTAADPPLSFGWSLTTLATDALSVWEYNQMYSKTGLVHMNGEKLDRTEYFARGVWFPVETLKLSITLPSRTPGPAFPGYFLLDQNETIRVEDVIREQVLYINPPHDCVAAVQGKHWKRQAADGLVQSGQFTRISPLTWELTVPGPMVGSCYSLDWPLPEGRRVEKDPLESETSAWRQQLLQHRASRLSGKGNSKVRKLVRNLAQEIYAKYGGAEPNEKVTISLLAYDEERRGLQFVDGSLNGNEPSNDMWDLWLPFAAGLVGACFRQQADVPFIYFAPENGETRIGPEIYLPIPGQIQHTVLLALPLTHPQYAAPVNSTTFESARQRVAVLDIGSDSPRTKLREFRGPERDAHFQELIRWSRTFVENLVSVLREDLANANA